MDLVKNFFPVETSTKLTLLSLGCMSFFTRLSLSCLKPRIGFVDYIQATTAADNLTVGVTIFKSFDRRRNFHFSYNVQKQRFVNYDLFNQYLIAFENYFF